MTILLGDNIHQIHEDDFPTCICSYMGKKVCMELTFLLHITRMGEIKHIHCVYDVVVLFLTLGYLSQRVIVRISLE